MRQYLYYVRGEKHRDMAIVSAQSVHRIDPGAALSIVTDDKTDLSPCKPYFSFLGHATFGQPLRLMTANVAVIADQLLSAEEGDELWFIDPDTILLRPLDMPEKADMVATWRVVTSEIDEQATKDMPYNFGVVGFRGSPGAVDAALWIRERVASLNNGYQDWYGNQMALAQLAGPIPKEDEAIIVKRGIPWRPFEPAATHVTIARLPCAEWNYTPSSLEEDVSEKRLLHFKGVRRKLMPAFARKLGYEMEDFRSE